MKLSRFQENIVNAVLHGNGNIMIQAFAGCGKTSTLIEIMKVLPTDTTKLYCAFNKDIVEDITSKTVGIENLKISTIHSLGYKIIQSNTDFKVEVDENKYNNHVNNCIQEYSQEYSSLNYNQQSKYRANVKKLLNYVRNNISYGLKSISDISEKFGIVPISDEINSTQQILLWGKDNIKTIDYGDMVWLPCIKPYHFPYFDYVFVDEAQDLSLAQQNIVLHCHNIKTRYIFCGDEFQSIYAFAGADSDSFKRLSKLNNTTTYYLPICYRCDDLIVDFASQIVSKIQHNSNKIDGKIFLQGNINDIGDGDMVLCRNNAPLAKLYLKLLNEGKPCYILGKDIQNDLVDLINSTEKDEISSDLSKDGIVPQLMNRLFEIRDYIKAYEKCDDKSAITTISFRNLYDQIQTILILSEGLTKKEELINRIKEIFSETKKEGISLSTIHKAKGLENDNVHILCWSLFGNNAKRINTEWEKQQETNLKYVAVTRAKHKLSLIEDSEYSKYSNIPTLEEIAAYEYQINTILGIKKNPLKITKEYADEVVKHFEEIKRPNKSNMVLGLTSSNQNKTASNNLANIFKNKFTKLKK